MAMYVVIGIVLPNDRVITTGDQLLAQAGQSLHTALVRRDQALPIRAAVEHLDAGNGGAQVVEAIQTPHQRFEGRERCCPPPSKGIGRVCVVARLGCSGLIHDLFLERLFVPTLELGPNPGFDADLGVA